MARKVTAGLVGEPSLGAISVAPTAVITAAENLNITLTPQGTGNVVMTKDIELRSQTDIKFGDADSSNYIHIQAPTNVGTDYTLTLPAAVAGTSGFALISDTSGNLSWAAAGAALTDNNSDSGTNYVTFTTLTSGFMTTARVATSARALTYQPSTGTLSTTIFNETSSIALKENFRPIDDALDKILQLTGLIYDRKDGSNKDEVGLIAEDVDQIIPNIVGKDKDGKPSNIAYQRLTAYLVEAVKQIKQEIDQLKGSR
jgi:hypothetical protein